MKTHLIASAAAAVLAIGMLAANPAGAAPLAPGHFGAAGQHIGTNAQQVHYRYWHQPNRQSNRRALRRHFYAPGPWAFGRVPFYNCVPLGRSGFICFH
jgi:hypothetical protein